MPRDNRWAGRFACPSCCGAGACKQCGAGGRRIAVPATEISDPYEYADQLRLAFAKDPRSGGQDPDLVIQGDLPTEIVAPLLGVYRPPTTPGDDPQWRRISPCQGASPPDGQPLAWYDSDRYGSDDAYHPAVAVYHWSFGDEAFTFPIRVYNDPTDHEAGHTDYAAAFDAVAAPGPPRSGHAAEGSFGLVSAWRSNVRSGLYAAIYYECEKWRADASGNAGFGCAKSAIAFYAELVMRFNQVSLPRPGFPPLVVLPIYRQAYLCGTSDWWPFEAAFQSGAHSLEAFGLLKGGQFGVFDGLAFLATPPWQFNEPPWVLQCATPEFL